MNAFDQMRDAIAQARQVEHACRQHADEMAGLLIGKLDAVSTHKLKQLKKELRNFNIHTGRWRNK